MSQRISVVLLACYWVAMVVGTHVPAEHLPYTFSWADKVIHFVAYAGLAMLIINAFGVRPGASGRGIEFGVRAIVGLALLLLLHGAIDEVTQSFIPGRHPSVADWIADGIGGGLGIAACWLWMRRSRIGGGDFDSQGASRSPVSESRLVSESVLR